MIEEIRNKIVEIAYSYEFQKEIKGNKGFQDDIFQQKMEAVGWEYKQAWCCYLTELTWREAYSHFDSSIANRLDKLFSANAYKTFENFRNARGFKTYTNQNFEPGDLVIWVRYKNGETVKNGSWTLGHIAICTKPAQLFLLTMDGNTNEKGSPEGDIVAEKKRGYDFYKDNGLRLIGGIKPCEV